MINMKTSKKEADLVASESMDSPEYPYGLRISLDNESLEKLGITKLPDVGEQMHLVAHVTVQSVSAYEHQGDTPSRSVELQITDMAMGKPPSDARELYPNSSMN